MFNPLLLTRNSESTPDNLQPPQSAIRNPNSAIEMLRVIALILGIAVAAWGGVILFRALFLDPSGTAVINEATGAIREYPNMARVAIGTVMLIGGACTAFYAARRKPM